MIWTGTARARPGITWLWWRYLWNSCQGDEKFVFEPVDAARESCFPRRPPIAAGESTSPSSELATQAVVKTLPRGGDQ